VVTAAAVALQWAADTPATAVHRPVLRRDPVRRWPGGRPDLDVADARVRVGLDGSVYDGQIG